MSRATEAPSFAGDPGGSSLYLDIVNGSMPPGGPQLADTVVSIVSEYIVELGKR